MGQSLRRRSGAGRKTALLWSSLLQKSHARKILSGIRETQVRHWMPHTYRLRNANHTHTYSKFPVLRDSTVKRRDSSNLRNRPHLLRDKSLGYKPGVSKVLPLLKCTSVGTLRDRTLGPRLAPGSDKRQESWANPPGLLAPETY